MELCAEQAQELVLLFCKETMLRNYWDYVESRLG